jgi:hypothetical protein
LQPGRHTWGAVASREVIVQFEPRRLVPMVTRQACQRRSRDLEEEWQRTDAGPPLPFRGRSDAVIRRETRPVEPERHFRPAEQVSGVRWSLDRGRGSISTRAAVGEVRGASSLRHVGAASGEYAARSRRSGRPALERCPRFAFRAANLVATRTPHHRPGRRSLVDHRRPCPSGGADRRAPEPSSHRHPRTARTQEQFIGPVTEVVPNLPAGSPFPNHHSGPPPAAAVGLQLFDRDPNQELRRTRCARRSSRSRSLRVAEAPQRADGSGVDARGRRGAVQAPHRDFDRREGQDPRWPRTGVKSSHHRPVWAPGCCGRSLPTLPPVPSLNSSPQRRASATITTTSSHRVFAGGQSVSTRARSGSSSSVRTRPGDSTARALLRAIIERWCARRRRRWTIPAWSTSSRPRVQA